jgi:hypothetical protein
VTTPALVHFGELPPDGRSTNHSPGGARSRELAAQAAALMARPGEWARLAVHTNIRHAYDLARRIRTGSLAAFRPIGCFEATGREVDGHGEVWARYVGNTEQPEDAQQ